MTVKASFSVALLLFTAGSVQGGIHDETDFCSEAMIPPELCSNNQQLCPQEPDEFGCDTADFCFPRTDKSGNCPIECPPACGAGEIFCMGLMQSNGCIAPHTCKDRHDPVTGCQNFCDIKCGNGEKMCPGVKEECCGVRNECCAPQPVCVPEGDDCPRQDFDSDGCPIIRTETTQCDDQGQMVCSGGFDHNGCALPNYCYTPDVNIPEHCSVHCPAACNLLYEHACPPTFDINGCPNEPTCSRFEVQCPGSGHMPDTGCLFSDYNYRVVCNNREQICTPDPVYKKTFAPADIAVHRPNTICERAPTCENRMMTGRKHHCAAYCPTQCVQVNSNIDRQSWISTGVCV